MEKINPIFMLSHKLISFRAISELEIYHQGPKIKHSSTDPERAGHGQ